METTGGSLTVGDRSFRMHLHASGGFVDPSKAATEVKEDVEEKADEPQPTPSLMLRYIGGLTQAELRQAFMQFGQVQAVHIPTNFAGKPKNFARVDFHSVSEASTALGRLANAGSMVCGRRISAAFAQPENDEDVVRVEAARKAEEDGLQESKQKALNGINGSMWAEYMQLFKDGSLMRA
eukprot:UN1307